jgi:hypothetical protein
VGFSFHHASCGGWPASGSGAVCLLCPRLEACIFHTYANPSLTENTLYYTMMVWLQHSMLNCTHHPASLMTTLKRKHAMCDASTISLYFLWFLYIILYLSVFFSLGPPGPRPSIQVLDLIRGMRFVLSVAFPND